MTPADRFKPYAPDRHAAVRLVEALPPDHPVQVFVDSVGGIDLGHFLSHDSAGTKKPGQPYWNTIARAAFEHVARNDFGGWHGRELLPGSVRRIYRALEALEVQR